MGEDLLELILGEREQTADADRHQPDDEQPVEHRLSSASNGCTRPSTSTPAATIAAECR